MAVTVKKITLWRSEVENKSGMLARTLKPLADARASLQVVMAYRFPGEPTRGAIELSPLSGKKSQAAAMTAGLDRSSIPTLLAMGDDRPGLGSEIAEAIAGAGINMVQPDTSVEEAMAIMTDRRIRHLPVVHNGKLAGIVSIGDLVKQISQDRKFEIQYLTDYITGKYPG